MPERDDEIPDLIESLWLIAEDQAGGLLPFMVPEDEASFWIVRTTPLSSQRLDETKKQRDYGAMHDNGVLG
jgi:hypothetical protein